MCINWRLEMCQANLIFQYKGVYTHTHNHLTAVVHGMDLAVWPELRQAPPVCFYGWMRLLVLITLPSEAGCIYVASHGCFYVTPHGHLYVAVPWRLFMWHWHRTLASQRSLLRGIGLNTSAVEHRSSWVQQGPWYHTLLFSCLKGSVSWAHSWQLCPVVGEDDQRHHMGEDGTECGQLQPTKPMCVEKALSQARH